MNSDRLKTSGIDFAAALQWEAGAAGAFSAPARCTRLIDYVLTEGTLGSVGTGVNFAGRYFNFTFGLPRHRGYLDLGWTLNAHQIGARIQHTGSYGGPFPRFENGAATAEPWRVDSLATLDLQYSLSFNSGSTRLQVGCRNCGDEAPPTIFNPQGDGLYDHRGALLYTRIEHRF